MIVQAFLRAIGGGGGVSSVTGTFPIASSGGATPDISITGVYPRTYAQMQALVGTSGLIAGLTYQITNAYGGFAVINIKAFSTDTLEDYGFGTFQNSNMSVAINCFMWYDLTSNKIYRIYDPLRNNDVKQFTYNAIDFFVFNSNSATNNVIEDITILGMTEDDVLNGNYFGNGAVINLDSHNISLTNCRVGAGKSLNLKNLISNYTADGKIYEGNVSTFEVTPNDDPSTNIVGSTVGMANFQWAGIVQFDTGGTSLDSFTNFPTDHSWIYTGMLDGTASGDITVEDKNAGGGNINLEVSGSTIIIADTGGDYLEFQTIASVSTEVQKINGFIRS